MKIKVGNIVRGTRKGRFRLFRGQTGFTLIEVLVAVVILAAIGVTVPTYDSSANTTSTTIFANMGLTASGVDIYSWHVK